MVNRCLLAVAGDVFDGVLCCPFSHTMSWMKSGTELSQFLRIVFLLLLPLSHGVLRTKSTSCSSRSDRFVDDKQENNLNFIPLLEKFSQIFPDKIFKVQKIFHS